MSSVDKSNSISNSKSPTKDIHFNNDKSYLPDCWNDDKRMDVLFNPFRIREINPEGWDLKMTFWINLINKWCFHQRRVVFTIDDIRHEFIRDQRIPHLDCIKLVVSQMKRQNKLLFKDELDLNKPTSSLASWALNSFIMKPFSFGWSLISKNDSNNFTDEDKVLPIYNDYPLINKESLEILSESVESGIKTIDSTCWSYSKFLFFLNKNIFTDKCPDEASINAILKYLELKNKIKIHDESGIKIVKFGDAKIKDSDVELVRLELTKEVLEKEIIKIEEKIEKFDQEVRTALKNNNKDKALMMLRRKKRLEKRLNDREQQVFSVESLYEQLLESGSNVLMIGAFKAANNTLKKNLAKMEDVDKIMSQLDETLNDVSVLNSELNRPIGETTEFELEAENELEELLQEMEEEKDQSKELNDKDVASQLDKLKIADISLPLDDTGDNQIEKPIKESFLAQ